MLETASQIHPRLTKTCWNLPLYYYGKRDEEDDQFYSLWQGVNCVGGFYISLYLFFEESFTIIWV